MSWICVTLLDPNFLTKIWRNWSCMNFFLVKLCPLLVPCLYHNWKASSITGFCVCLHLQTMLFEKV